MQIPILNGIYTDENSDFRVSYPRNLSPIPVKSGISNGYLKMVDGPVEWGDPLPGIDRDGVNWNDVCYRVAGQELVSIADDGTVTTIGAISGTDQATLDYSFDYLGITAGGNFYLYNGTTLQQVTDPDLGIPIDHIWIDGYFMLTDGEFLIVTDLNDPFSINPLKYGSSEVDPDPVKALLKLNNETNALNRYTIEVFDNIGGSGFPFQRIDGAQVSRGAISTHACNVFMNAVAFVGGGRNESLAVWLSSSGSSTKISTREIDKMLANYGESQLQNTIMEVKVDQSNEYLIINLPNETVVYDAGATKAVGEPVWFILGSGVDGKSRYLSQNLIYCYDKWLIADPTSARHGYLSRNDFKHWGNSVGWEFNTAIVYNEGNGVVFHELELVSLTGREKLGIDDTIGTNYSTDGETFSVAKFIKAGKQGERNKRLIWLKQGRMKHWRIQRFFGQTTSQISPARIEARLEGLSE